MRLSIWLYVSTKRMFTYDHIKPKRDFFGVVGTVRDILITTRDTRIYRIWLNSRRFLSCQTILCHIKIYRYMATFFSACRTAFSCFFEIIDKFAGTYFSLLVQSFYPCLLRWSFWYAQGASRKYLRNARVFLSTIGIHNAIIIFSFVIWSC